VHLEWSGRFGEKTNLLPLSGIELLFSGSPARSLRMKKKRFLNYRNRMKPNESINYRRTSIPPALTLCALCWIYPTFRSRVGGKEENKERRIK
jgi:hypothetical protein